MSILFRSPYVIIQISKVLNTQISPPRGYCLSYGAIFINILLRKILISVFPLRSESKLHSHSIYLRKCRIRTSIYF